MGEQGQPERSAPPTGSAGRSIPSSPHAAKLSGQILDAGPHIPPPPPAAEGRASGLERRIDHAHGGIPDDDVYRAAGQPAAHRPTVAVPRSSQTDDELLLQASQIAEHLRAQSAELDRREKALNEQLSLLDQERRRVRLWVHQFEEEMYDRDEALKKREAEFAEKLASCEALVKELEEQERVLLGVRDQLNAERATWREDAARELEIDRQALRHTQHVLDAERKQLAEETERRRAEHQANLHSAREQLEEDRRRLADEIERERAQLRERLAADLEAERAQFELEKQNWQTQRAAEQKEIAREREIVETAIQRAEEELSQFRSGQLAELDQLRQEQERQLDEERQQLEEERRQQEEALAESLSMRMAELEREREAYQAAQLKLRGEIDEERARLAKEQTLAENRVRFQQEHLQKARHDLETERNEFRREQQRAQTTLEHDALVMRLRRTQLDQFRAVLDERELSLARERQILAEARGTLERELEADRERLTREREAWRAECEMQRAELRRQEDLLALNTEHLESRRMRLDDLRAELEQTHRNTLEMRLAVEETWARLAQRADFDAVRGRVDETRAALEEHYRHAREGLERLQREVTDARAALARQQEEFRTDQRSFTEWSRTRDDELRTWEERLRRDEIDLETRESAWRALRNRWMREKSEAEQIIRELLAQLAERTDPNAGEESSAADDAPGRADESDRPRRYGWAATSDAPDDQ